MVSYIQLLVSMKKKKQAKIREEIGESDNTHIHNPPHAGENNCELTHPHTQ